MGLGSVSLKMNNQHTHKETVTHLVSPRRPGPRHGSQRTRRRRAMEAGDESVSHCFVGGSGGFVANLIR